MGEGEFNRAVSKVKGNYLFDLYRKHLEEENKLVEAQLDTSDAGITERMYDEVWEKAEPHLTREVCHVIQCDSTSQKVPVPTAGTAGALSGGTFPSSGEAYGFQTLSVDINVGVNANWTREFLEEANWDVVSRQVKETGRAVEENIMGSIVAAANAVLFSEQAGGATFTVDGTLTWKNVVDGIAKVEAENFHVDKVLVGPAMYGELLNNGTFVNAAIVGSDQAIRSGVIPTMLGVDFIRTSKCPADTMHFIDSSAFMAMGIFRDLQVEPYERPETNKYGIVTSMRYGLRTLQKKAFVKGQR